MSRKKPPVNPPPEPPSKQEELQTSWQQLVAKMHLHQIVTGNKAPEGQTQSKPLTDHLPPQLLKPLKSLVSKLPWRKTSSYDPVQAQRESLAEIGRELYQVRRQQQISLEAIATDTLISIGLLKAIEKGILEELPEPIYTRGLIKKFADYLGLDGSSLASRLPTDMVVKSAQSSRFRIWLPSIQLRPIHLYFLYIAIVMLSVQGISNHLKRSSLELETGNLSSDLSLESPSVKVSSPLDSSSVNTKPKALAKPVVVDIQLKDDCWLKVVVDGKTFF
jgi:transcriptional regulator with XRE-family HTH domain